MGWGKMRFTGTSSACFPWGPSASVTVHRSSFWALQGEQPMIGKARMQRGLLETLPSAYGHHPARPHAGLFLPGGREGGPWRSHCSEWAECRQGRQALRGHPEAREPGRAAAAARGQQRPASRWSSSQPPGKSWTPRCGWAGRSWADIPCEAVRRGENPGRCHQDAATQRLPAELQPHQPGPRAQRCGAAPHDAAMGPRHVDCVGASLTTRPQKRGI